MFYFLRIISLYFIILCSFSSFFLIPYAILFYAFANFFFISPMILLLLNTVFVFFLFFSFYTSYFSCIYLFKLFIFFSSSLNTIIYVDCFSIFLFKNTIPYSNFISFTVALWLFDTSLIISFNTWSDEFVLFVF